jgi:transcriptional regulator with XRE-family HTH domain
MKRGGVPATVKARKLLRIQRTHELLRKGWSLPKIAEDLNVSVQQVKHYRTEAFHTVSTYPSSYTAEEVAHFRAEEADLISETEATTISALSLVKERIGTDNERSLDASAAARLADSIARLSERKARLLGLDQPTKIIEEQTRHSLHLELKQENGLVRVEFDREQLRPKWPALERVHDCERLTNGANAETADKLLPARINDSDG